ncbi:hypothetical protein Fuma_00774 [Fuerstiella marisgermanici]|uniref:Uncharacterized protein n=1 Tax=Fuerstiella marisgermanici TaxID=1891926 RepID=A0A1P8WAU3_9PLAN|nr:hypothetical protein Fuma_00774 [Fuerstiella marisgermanici]
MDLAHVWRIENFLSDARFKCFIFPSGSRSVS